jgi:hypothetical protein
MFTDRSVCHNSERQRLSHEFRSRALSLTQKLEHVKFDKEEKEKQLKIEFEGIKMENKMVSKKLRYQSDIFKFQLFWV